MKFLFTIALISFSFVVVAQRTYVYGVVKDSSNHEKLVGVHIQNINAGSLTSTNEKGVFRLPAQPGDTLVVSSIGYQTLAWIVDSSWFENEKEREFLLPVNTIQLDEVVVGDFPAYEDFKEQIISTEVVDSSFTVFGVPQVVMKQYNQLEKKQYLNPKFVFFHPVSAIHHSFSKREKEKRKMQQILKSKHTTTEAYLKFTRAWVSENTKLEGDKLTDFIAYCDFSVEYLAESTVFDIHQRMISLLPDFLAEYEKG